MKLYTDREKDEEDSARFSKYFTRAIKSKYIQNLDI